MLIISVVLVLSATAARAGSVGDTVSVDSLRIVGRDGDVSVSFTVRVGGKAVGSDHTLVLVPVLTNGCDEALLTPVAVRGRRAERLAGRYEWVSGRSSGSAGALYTVNGGCVKYEASVPSREWMRGADLVVRGVDRGCCTGRILPVSVLAENILSEPAEPPVAEIWTPPVPAVVSMTVADSLAKFCPFLADISEFDEHLPPDISDSERENALVVYYAQGSGAVDESYRDNRQTLSGLVRVVNMIMNDPHGEVAKIVVAGFSSPEGSAATNSRLAGERARSVKDHIVRATGVSAGDVLLHNGSVDWRGLRLMVSRSDMPERDEVLDIIDNVPVWDVKTQRGRHGELMRLNGGAAYRYISREYFPLMRNGAFIKVYYRNK